MVMVVQNEGNKREEKKASGRTASLRRELHAR